MVERVKRCTSDIGPAEKRVQYLNNKYYKAINISASMANKQRILSIRYIHGNAMISMM